MASRKQEELVIIVKTYDLMKWCCEHTSKFPRNYRSVLGERIDKNLSKFNVFCEISGSD